MEKEKNVKNADVEEIESKVDSKLDDDYEELTMEERIINIEKKSNYTFILSIIILIVCVLTMIFAINGTSSEVAETETPTTEENSNHTYDTSAFDKISASDIKTESKNKAIVVLIARQGCSWCASFAPLITDVAKDYNVKVKYIDLATIIDFTQNPAVITDEEAFTTLQNLEGEKGWETFASKNIGGTPLTLIIKNNKVIGGIGGYTESDKIATAFEDAGLKK